MVSHFQSYQASVFDSGNDARFHRQSQYRETSSDGVSSSRNVIINYLPSSLKENDLYSLLSSQIAVEKVKIIRKRNGNSKGFGFACFYTREDAQKAMEIFNGYVVGSKRLKLTWSRPKKRGGCNLCVQNVPR